ncbi:universal stress protein [Chromohalobacter canadensis]|uniref:universal stress protein n=1 Tax=Chromohalobacter canadensis TaxID=141389 RepID=UPI00240FFFE9|nr:universal stress protein [Chromohalobacter canadensis]
MYKSILVPMNDSLASMSALYKAHRLAQRENAQLHLLHVVEPRDTGDVIGEALGAPIHQMDAQDCARAEASLDSWWKKVNQPRGEVNLVVKSGKIDEAISEEVGRLEVDIIIMGSTKATHKWRGILLKVQRKVSCGLVVINEREDIVLEHFPS